MSQSQRLKAYGKLIRGFLMVASAIYEMIFNEEAPKWSSVIGNQ
jgi:hypothetical protein